MSIFCEIRCQSLSCPVKPIWNSGEICGNGIQNFRFKIPALECKKWSLETESGLNSDFVPRSDRWIWSCKHWLSCYNIRSDQFIKTTEIKYYQIPKCESKYSLVKIHLIAKWQSRRQRTLERGMKRWRPTSKNTSTHFRTSKHIWTR